MFNPNEAHNIKTHAIQILSENHGKTAKQIHVLIRQKTTTTYQATHKALNQLTREKILEKNGQTYTLSTKWVQDTKKFLEKAENNLTNPERIELDQIKQNTTVTLEFYENFVTPFYWLLHEMAEYVKRKKPQENTIIVMYGAWPVMMVGKKEYDELRTITKAVSTKLICTTNNPLDGIVLEFWKKRFGTQYVKNAKTSNKLDEIIFDDFIIQFENPPEIIQWTMKSFAKQILDLPGIYRLYLEKKVRVKITIIKNNHLTNQYRNSLLKCFKT